VIRCEQTPVAQLEGPGIATLEPSGGAPASLLHKTGWSALAGVSTVTGKFLVTIITARRLGPEGAGRLAYLFWIAEIVATVMGFGMQSSVTRFVANLCGQNRAAAAPGFARWLYIRYMVLTLCGAAAIGAVAFLPRHRATSAANWTCLGVYFVLQAMGAFYLAYLGGAQRFDRVARVNLISSCVLVVGVVAGTVLLGITGTLAGYAAGAAVPAALSLNLFRHRGARRDLDAGLASRCLKYAAFAWCAAVVSAFVWSRVEIVFLERSWGPQTVAMFTVGLSLSAVAVQGPMLLGGALMPHFAESASAGYSATARRTYATGTRLLAMLLFPLCLGLASLMPVLLPALYGDLFRAAVPSAMVLTAVSALAFTNVGSALVYGSGRSWFVAASGLAGAVLSLACCVIIIPRWGAWGASLSRSAVQFSMVALGAWYISRYLMCPLPLAALGKILLAAMVAALCSYTSVSLVPSVVVLPVAVLLAGIVYLLMLRVVRVLEADDERSLRHALDRMPALLSSPLSCLLGWLVI
jgi:O-antigen/teichoic acid export membrane protein